jgi:hypothetical protein
MYVSLETSPAPPTDLDFIAAARQDVPRLVAEIRRLTRAQLPTRSRPARQSCLHVGTDSGDWHGMGAPTPSRSDQHAHRGQ